MPGRRTSVAPIDCLNSIDGGTATVPVRGLKAPAVSLTCSGWARAPAPLTRWPRWVAPGSATRSVAAGPLLVRHGAIVRRAEKKYIHTDVFDVLSVPAPLGAST